MSDDIGLNYRTVRRWFTRLSPQITSLIKVANYFHCSLDYLVGLSTTEFDYAPLTDKINFTARYTELKKETGLKDAKISGLCQVSPSTVYSWNNGTIPSLETIVDLCKIFDCTFEYIIGRID